MESTMPWTDITRRNYARGGARYIKKLFAIERPGQDWVLLDAYDSKISG